MTTTGVTAIVRKRIASRTDTWGCILVLLALPALLHAQPPAAPSETSRQESMSYDEAIRALQSTDAQRRHAGAIALVKMGESGKRAVPPIVEILETTDMKDRTPLLHLLQLFGPASEPAIPLMTEGLKHDDLHVRYLCCRVLGAIGPAAKPVVPQLIGALDDPVASVRRNAAVALGKLGPKIAPQAVPALTTAVTDPIHLVRVAAILALAEFGELAAPAITVLETRANDPKSNERSHAAAVLFRLTNKPEPARTILVGELNRGRHSADAAQMLVRLAGQMPGAIDELINALNNEQAVVRMDAAEALGRSGPRGKPALAALRQLLEDEQPSVRESAQAAIERIEAAITKSKNKADN
jgi:HEAT repeat protein